MSQSVNSVNKLTPDPSDRIGYSGTILPLSLKPLVEATVNLYSASPNQEVTL